MKIPTIASENNQSLAAASKTEPGKTKPKSGLKTSSDRAGIPAFSPAYIQTNIACQMPMVKTGSAKSAFIGLTSADLQLSGETNTRPADKKDCVCCLNDFKAIIQVGWLAHSAGCQRTC